MIKNLLFLGALFMGVATYAQDKKEILNYTDINGMKQGHWIKKNTDGNILYEGYFQNNFPTGTFTRFHDNGQKKSELIFDENRDKYCSVKMWDNSGELAATGFYNNKAKDSIWEYFSVNEKMVYHEVYKNGLRHGICKKYYPNGKIAEEKAWAEGKMDGIWMQYYPDGTLRLKSAHKKDARIGEFIVNQANGKPLVSGAYKNDVKEGTWKTFTPKGEVEKEMVFIDGKLENDEELAKELTKELEEAEKLKDQFPEPSNYADNPEEYFLNRK